MYLFYLILEFMAIGLMPSATRNPFVKGFLDLPKLLLQGARILLGFAAEVPAGIPLFEKNWWFFAKGVNKCPKDTASINN
jgi:hypothetical protein